MPKNKKHKPRVRGPAEPPKWVRIRGIVFDDDSREAKYRVQFTDEEGHRKVESIDRAKFVNPSDALKLLVRLNARLPDKAADDLKKDLHLAAKLGDKATKHVTARTGWTTRNGEPASFIYFDQTFGRRARALLHKGAATSEGPGRRKGTVNGWSAGLAAAFGASDYLIFAASVPAAGPLLNIVGHTEGAVYHIHGGGKAAVHAGGSASGSSSGKTLAARVGLSLMNECLGQLNSFDATARGLEEYCAEHNNLLGILDDASRTAVKGIPAGELPYFLANGAGRRRSAGAELFPNLTWLLPVITTGEDPLDDPWSSEGRREGAIVRMVPIPVPPGSAGGIFNRVTVDATTIVDQCNDLAAKVLETIGAHYGVAMPAYLGQLVYRRTKLEPQIRHLVSQFVTKHGADTDPWERRYAEKFGIVDAAAVLLSRFKIAPWSESRAHIAITTMYQKSRSSIVNATEATDAFLQRLPALAKKGHFSSLNKGTSLPPSQAHKLFGVIRDFGSHKNVFVVPPDRFKQLVKPAAAAAVVERELERRKLLLKGSDKNRRKQVMIQGATGASRRRYICVLSGSPRCGTFK